jgi:hypothetical protein
MKQEAPQRRRKPPTGILDIHAGEHVNAFVSYDERLHAAAATLGLPTAIPGRRWL